MRNALNDFEGTPNEKIWKGVEKLPEYNSRFPSWKRRDLRGILKSITPDGLILLKVSLHLTF